MSFHYDPITGEKIEDEVSGYDPMTGEPICKDDTEENNTGENEFPEENNSTEERKITGYDPMTGEPVYEESMEERKITGYDPMTGEPVYEEVSVKQEITGYDPMTGEPIYRVVSTEKKMNIPAISGSLKKILITAAAIIAGVAVLLIVALFIVLGKNGRFLLAMKKTYDPGAFVEILDVSDLFLKGKYHINVSASAYDLGIEGGIAVDQNKGSYYTHAKLDADGEEYEAKASLDRKKAVLSFPMLIDDPVVYYYTEERTGFLKDNYDMNQVDELLETATTNSFPGKYRVKVAWAFLRAFNKLDFEKIDKETFKINKKKRKCKGYEVEINEDATLWLFDELSKIWDEYSAEYDLDESVIGPVDSFFSDTDELSDLAEELSDLSVRIYLYSGRIAAADVLDKGIEVFQVRFKGGNYWMENMTLNSGGVEAEISGSVKNRKEKRTLSVAGQNIVSYEYNKKTGDTEVTAGVGTYSITVKGELKKKGKGFSLTVDDASAMGYSLSSLARDARIKLTVDDGASIKKISEKDAYDLGSMSEGEFEDMGKEIERNARGLEEDIKDAAGELINNLPRSIAGGLASGLF